MEERYKVGIIGGGAAGLFAASFLKKDGVSFVILERGEEVGRKLLLTGHGRSNITNRKSPSDLKSGYHEAGNFIYPAIRRFTPEDAVRFIEEELKVPLKEEDNNRMFPVSDSAKTIRDALVGFIGEENIKTGFMCTDIITGPDGFEAVAEDGRKILCDKIILACGGMSYPKTGSDGSGYKLASRLGHKITSLVPSLCSVEVADKDREFTAEVSGVSVNAGASLYYDNRKQAAGEGEVLFTHKGVSGPVIHGISREIPRDITTRDGWIELDFTPGRKDEEVDRELMESIRIRPDTKLTTIGADYVPSSLSNALGKRAGVTDLYAKNCDRSARKEYLRQLKHLELRLEKAPGYETAYVTRGGVDLKELKRESMESKIVPGVYVVGEIADIDGISGGYNLQAAMSEAFIAVKDVINV